MRILLAVEPADFRKGIDGLAQLCRQRLQADPLSGAMFIWVCSTICGFLTNRIWVVSLMRVQAAGDVASGQALGPGFWPVGLAWGAAGPRMRKWRGPRSIGAVRSGCWTAVPGQSTAPAAHARATHPLGAIG
jgi:hypothetical protein